MMSGRILLTFPLYLTLFYVARGAMVLNPVPFTTDTINLGPGNDDEETLAEINVTILLPVDPWYVASMRRTGPAIILGFQKVKQLQLLPDYRVNLHYSDSKCSNVFAPMEAMRYFMFDTTVQVFFGPSCELALAPVARFMRFWETPLLTAGALTADYSAPKTSPFSEFFLTTRTGLGFAELDDFLIKIFTKHNWKKTMLIYERDGMEEVSGTQTCRLFMSGFAGYLNDNGLAYDNFNLDTNNVTGIKDMLEGHLGLKYAVVVLCASPVRIREILLAAEELKMVSSGEYVFFNVELFANPNKDYSPWQSKDSTNEENVRARTAYEALLTLTVRPPPDSPEYNEFVQNVKEKAIQKFNFSFGEEPVNSFVTAFYDAVLLYALALNETLEAGGTVSNGSEITRRMWGQTFQGITGNVSIDENGDRNADYSLLDMNITTGIFQVVAHYSGKTKEIIDVPDRKIHWAGNRDSAPPDTPKCGFDGSGCPTMPQYAIVVIVLSSALVIILISFFFIYRTRET